MSKAWNKSPQRPLKLNRQNRSIQKHKPNRKVRQRVQLRQEMVLPHRKLPEQRSHPSQLYLLEELVGQVLPLCKADLPVLKSSNCRTMSIHGAPKTDSRQLLTVENIILKRKTLLPISSVPMD